MLTESDLYDQDSLSISYLNALEYCPRRFYYECALSEFLDNAHVVEGTMRHERSDSGRTTSEDGVTTLRRVWVWSDRLRLSGFADVVEEQEGQLTPVEYKKGKMGEWLNDHVQLCAQALCLEEMLNSSIPLVTFFTSAMPTAKNSSTRRYRTYVWFVWNLSNKGRSAGTWRYTS